MHSYVLTQSYITLIDHISVVKIRCSESLKNEVPVARFLCRLKHSCLFRCLQEHNHTLSTTSKTSFTAVCAIAARYPLPTGASPLDSAKSGADQFWHTLSAGANLPVTVPVSRWDIDDVYSPELAAKKMCVPSKFKSLV